MLCCQLARQSTHKLQHPSRNELHICWPPWKLVSRSDLVGMIKEFMGVAKNFWRTIVIFAPLQEKCYVWPWLIVFEKNLLPQLIMCSHWGQTQRSKIRCIDSTRRDTNKILYGEKICMEQNFAVFIDRLAAAKIRTVKISIYCLAYWLVHAIALISWW